MVVLTPLTDVEEWEFHYGDENTTDSIIVGGDSTVDVVEVLGLDDLPDIESNDMPRTGTDGMWSGQDFARGRTITLTMETAAASDEDLETTLGSIRAVFAPRRSTDSALRFKYAGGDAKLVYCRPRRRALPVDYDRITRLVRIVVQFYACDPRIYSDEASQGTTTIPGSVSGLSWPTSWPLTWGGASTAGSIEATNDGVWPAPWQATIFGPITDPAISLDTGERLSFTASLAAGEQLTIDSLSKSVVLNGTANRYNWLDVGSEWFELAPGANTVSFSGSGLGQVVFSWRSTWI